MSRDRNHRAGSRVRPGVQRLDLSGRRTALAIGLAALLACGGTAADSTTEPKDAAAPKKPAAECPAEPRPVEVAPGTRPEHRTVEFWVEKIGADAADRVLVEPGAVADLNARFAEVEGAWHDPLDPALADPPTQQQQLDERMSWLRAQVVDKGTLVEGEAGSFAAAEAIVEAAQPVTELRVVAAEASLWCIPIDSGLYKQPIDRDFDRNRCASVHPGETVQVLRRAEPWWYVHAGHTVGWLHSPSLTPPMTAAELRGLREGPAVYSLDDDATTLEGGQRLRLGTRAPIVQRDRDRRVVLVPTPDGLQEQLASLGPQLNEGALPLTRRDAWALALGEQDTPYGWGGRAGHRDCSRLMRDVMATFGFELARHSGVQGKLGTHNVDVSGMGEGEKLDTLREWSKRGLVLLYMPGHIMMYLGEDEGQHYAVSAISEYLEPCEGGPDTVFEIGRVAVTTLELGRGSERTAYVERLSRLVVFAPNDPPASP